jgi:hypothetical protein
MNALVATGSCAGQCHRRLAAAPPRKLLLPPLLLLVLILLLLDAETDLYTL